VEREAVRRGFDRTRRQVVLGDGAPWIWNLASEAFPRATQIVDRFHAKEHLGEVAKTLYGTPSDLGDTWAAARHTELDAGQLLRAAPEEVDVLRRARAAKGIGGVAHRGTLGGTGRGIRSALWI